MMTINKASFVWPYAEEQRGRYMAFFLLNFHYESWVINSTFHCLAPNCKSFVSINSLMLCGFPVFLRFFVFCIGGLHRNFFLGIFPTTLAVVYSRGWLSLAGCSVCSQQHNHKYFWGKYFSLKSVFDLFTSIFYIASMSN